MCKTFAAVKYIFKLVTHDQIFDFAKLHTYGNSHKSYRIAIYSLSQKDEVSCY